MKPLPGVKVIQHESIKEEENETDNEKSNNSCTSSVTFSPQRNAPGNSGSSSLPKQKRLDSASNCATAPADATGASTNSHNVAVVSPMPSLRRKGASLDRAIASSSSSPKSGKKKKHEHGKEEEEDEEDPLKSVVPMAPLFRSPSAGCAAGMMHQMPTLVAYGAAIPGIREWQQLALCPSYLNAGVGRVSTGCVISSLSSDSTKSMEKPVEQGE